MKEYPMFVPFEEERLAAVLTSPSAPRGLVMLLQGGGGQSRSHRNRSWIRTARGLAERGIASVRMDYPGLGDSTGEPRFEVESPPVEAATAVTRVALDALGVRTFAAVGNCIGIPTALEMAVQIGSCETVVLIVPFALHPMMQQGRTVRRAQATRQVVGRRIPALRRAVRRARRTAIGRSAPASALRPEMAEILRSGSIQIQHGGSKDSWRQLRTQADRLRSEVGSDAAERLVLEALPTEGSGFRELQIQDAMIASTIDWLDRAMPDAQGVAMQALEPHAEAN
jgi:pimeloyl-ACP methyl ester carboxylesterase